MMRTEKQTLSIEQLETRRCLAVDFQLVLDINTQPITQAYPQHLTQFGSSVFFTATSPETGEELWKSDGTDEGTDLVKDIVPGYRGSRPNVLTPAGDQLFFFANASELWKSDGTSDGTSIVKNLNSVGLRSQAINVSGTLFFGLHSRASDSRGYELWKSDGTESGTALVHRFDFDASNSGPVFSVSGSTLFMAIPDGSPTPIRRLWKSDGTPEGTTLVSDRINIRGPMVDVHGTIYFATSTSRFEPHQLWKSDGTKDGTVMVSGMPPRDLTEFRDELYFEVVDEDDHSGLWKVDRNSGETVLISGAVPEDQTFNSSFPAVLGDSLVFFRRSGIWKTDGTTNGTEQIGDPWATMPPTAIGDVVFFEAFGDTPGEIGQLWKTDGTTSGTVKVTDTAPVREMTAAGTHVFFSTFVGGPGLWQSDGTAEGTKGIAPFDFGSQGSSPHGFAKVGDLLFFVADDGKVGAEPWITDGTTEGTTLLKDIGSNEVLDVHQRGSSPTRAFSDGETIFFLAMTESYEYQLWESDGTRPGTEHIPILERPNEMTMTIADMVGVDGNAYVAVESINEAEDLLSFTWVTSIVQTDGTPVGTTRLGDFPGTYNLWSHDENLFFGSRNALWWSDGTEDSVVLLREFAPTRHFEAVVGESLIGFFFFSAGTDSAGRELWKSDGTKDGTVMVADIRAGEDSSSPHHFTAFDDDRVIFSADDGSSGRELWLSDGTSAGTRLLKDLFPGTGSGNPRSFTAHDGEVYFVATDGVHGVELWKTDGTEAGTVMLRDVWIGSNGSTSGTMAVSDGRLYFSANDGSGGQRLWSTDGTAEGTIPIEDSSGSRSPQISGLFDFKDELYFVGLNNEFGNELYKMVDTTPRHRRGDFDDDGIVNFNDFLILANNFGKEVDSVFAGDANEDGKVDFTDFLILAQNFGKHLG